MFQFMTNLSGSLMTHKQLMQVGLPSLLNDAPAALALVGPEVLEIMHSMHLLVTAISSVEGGHTMVKPAAISNAIYSLEYRLLSLRSDSGDDLSGDSYIDLSKAIVIALHIFLHLAVRQLPRTAKMHVNMLRRLESVIVLDVASLDFFSSPVAQHLLLWMLFVGAAGALGTDSRPSFVHRLRHVCIDLQILDVGEFSEALRRVLWLNSFGKPHSSSLWDEMFRISIAELNF
jgi:hypothetical protein